MTGDPPTRLTRRVIPVVLGLAVVALYVPPVVSAGLRTDLGGHLLHAQQVELSGSSFAPYFLLYQAVVIVRALIPFSVLEAVVPAAGSRQATWEISAVVVMVGAMVVSAEAIYFRLLGTPGARSARAFGWTQAAAAAGLMVIAPITVLTWSNRQLVGGYVTVTSFDGATTMFLKPFALLLFFFVVDRMDLGSTRTRDIWVCAALSVLAWNAKASFAVCLAPALLVYIAVRLVRGRTVSWRFLIAGFFLPTVLIGATLTAGAAHAMGSEGRPGLALAPLRTVGDALAGRGQPLWFFAPLLLASCAFPIAVVAAYRRRVVTSPSLILSWLVFAAGAGQYYLFRITGKVDFGDLIGGAQIGLFLVYVESVRFAWSEERLAVPALGADRVGRPGGTRRMALSALFVVQVACGVLLLVQDVVDPAAWW